MIFIKESNVPKLEKVIRFIIGLCFLVIIITSLSVNVSAQVSANNDIAVLNEDDSIYMNVENNDYGLSEGIASVSIVTQTKYGGQLTVQDDFTILYVPERSFYGEDEFEYEICNTEGYCGQGTVAITVINVDFLPILLNDTITYYHSSDAIIDIISNDTLSDYPITISIEQDFTHGSSYLDADMNLVPSFSASFVGTDSLKYIVYDNDDDFAEAWLFVNVQYAGDELFIPNTFTPNGDGYNDYFLIPDFASYEGIQLQVFDSWGQVVYKSSNYKNDWDGEGNTGALAGKAVNEGTYYYVIKLPDGGVYTGYIFITR